RAGLVGADQDETFDVGRERSTNEMQCSQNVRLHAFAWIALQQRQVLMGSCVEHDLRPYLFEDLTESGLVSDIGHDQLIGIEQPGSVERDLKTMKVRFVVIDHVQGFRPETPDLS